MIVLTLTALLLGLSGFLPRSGDAIDPTVAATLRLRQEAAVAAARPPAPESFDFDPNVVTADELRRLGLDDRQVRSWLKYRGDRNNAFRSPADVGELFLLSQEEKDRLIPLAFVKKTVRASSGRQRAGFPFNPNTVGLDSLTLLGLSPKQAAAFVRFRDNARYPPAFRRPEDLRRFGAMNEDQAAHLVANAVIPTNKRPPPPRQRFRFDPNVVSVDSLQLLGFPAWQARMIDRYRAGRPVTFRQPEDLRRIDRLDSALVEELLELIDISPTAATAPRTYASAKPQPAPASLDINRADTSQWRSLPGIGSYRAKRIVRFREVLGGFVSPEQVGDTRGLPDSVFQQILPYLRASPVFGKLAINHADRATLAAHPYVSRNLANALVSYRENHGPFRSRADLKAIRILDEKTTNRLLPYLSFE